MAPASPFLVAVKSAASATPAVKRARRLIIRQFPSFTRHSHSSGWSQDQIPVGRALCLARLAEKDQSTRGRAPITFPLKLAIQGDNSP
jgi:hypothetical protein